MVTLTYRPGDSWHARHVSEFLACLRKWATRRGFKARYTWGAELQEKRGQRTGEAAEALVHYHVLVWLPRGLSMPKPDKQGWWRHGSTKVEWARNPVGYMVKYATKFKGRLDFPAGLRLHGAGGFDDDGRAIRHWLAQPGWLRAQVGVGQRVMRPKGGGVVVRSTGEFVPSPWRYGHADGVQWVREVFTYAAPIEARAPFSLMPGCTPDFTRQEVAH